MDLIFQTYYLSPIPCFLKIYALNRFLGWPFETQVRRAFFFKYGLRGLHGLHGLRGLHGLHECVD